MVYNGHSCQKEQAVLGLLYEVFENNKRKNGGLMISMGRILLVQFLFGLIYRTNVAYCSIYVEKKGIKISKSTRNWS